ncbi:hypothetical protein AC579_887 [Pseudocercospora musae]|uniref:DUF8035 domain-containing protein n=1 Tax=Pseudocercospora musae TaxID=113226 RepID=A0A139IN43_9PEZI|nr:hypothetical protein AC579_887 [Pseudocercospora musae]
MEQTKTSSYTGASLKRPRPVSSISLGSSSIHLPRVKPIAELTMSYNHRPLSPGARRLQNPARLSDNTLNDSSYYSQRHNSYASPRSSTSGVIPISTQTFINVPPPQNPRPLHQYDSYSGRPRRSSLVDTSRASASASTTQLPSRSRPTIIQQDIARPASPTKITSRETKDYYLTPASSQEPRTTTTTHKKLYSVDGDGSAKLVADVNIPVEPAGNRHHKRRDSVERGGYRSVGVEQQRDRGRVGRSYHTNGTHNRPRDKSIDDEDAYSYTDAAGMYRDTEPRWRDVRPRRGSVDRGGATSRERPASLLDPTFGQRQPAKDAGPPPSTRGWGRVNDHLGRTSSVREQPRVAQSPTRGRAYTDYNDPRDAYYVPPRTSSSDRRTTVHQPYDAYEYDREPRRERRHSITRDGNRLDRSVERRGFGIAGPAAAVAGIAAAGAYREGSQTRAARGDGRGSDESFERLQHRDPGYVPSEPLRRDTVPDLHQHDYQRLEQEKRDREYAQRIQAEERDRQRERELREAQPRRDDRGYDRDYDRDWDRPRDQEYDRDRERERERARQMEPPSERDRDRDRERDRERHHERRGTDRGEHGRKENSPRQSGEDLKPKTGLSQAATGGLAGAAAAFGLTGLLNKVSDKRDKDKERDVEKDRERERERDRERERHERRRDEERERDRDREKERERIEKERDRERDRRPASDEPPPERQQDRDREKQREQDRGLGFAFEAPPEPPRSAPPIDVRPPTNPDWQQERPQPPRTEERVPDRSLDRGSDRPSERPVERAKEHVPEPYQDRQAPTGNQERPAPREPERETQYDSQSTAQMPALPVDPDEDYRRRMEQIQRELGRTAESTQNSDSDPDRERRRREREQRRREQRESRGGAAAPAQMPAMPGAFSDDISSTVTGTTASESTVVGGDRDLRRKPSILDGPMTNESAQIIDNSMSDKRENRVRIVDPPTAEEEERRPKGILKKPTEKFPEHPDAIREGVAPLKDATKKGIPPGARWTKIDRRLVNPEALEASHERFEERLDCVIVLRVLTKEEIQKLADKTREIRDKRYDEDRKAKRSTRNRDRWERDEYEHSDSEDESKSRPPKLLEAPSTAGANQADFIRENERRHGEREAMPYSMSGGLGARDDRSREESRSRY